MSHTPDEYVHDLYYHALNYRGATSEGAEAAWQELKDCHDRINADLLAALEDICDSLGECGMTEKARAAIAKARGE